MYRKTLITLNFRQKPEIQLGHERLDTPNVTYKPAIWLHRKTPTSIKHLVLFRNMLYIVSLVQYYKLTIQLDKLPTARAATVTDEIKHYETAVS